MYSYVHLEGVGSDGVDGPPQALDGSVVAGGVGAMDTLADMAAAVVDAAARVLASEKNIPRWYEMTIESMISYQTGWISYQMRWDSHVK